MNDHLQLCRMTRRLTVFVDPERPYIETMGGRVDAKVDPKSGAFLRTTSA
jgi:hypothetical protein